MPGFWMAMLVMYFLGVQLRILPIIGNGNLKSMIMPMLSLGIPMICSYTRQVRVAVLEELSGNYVIGMRSRGVSERRILFAHVLPNAMIPIVNMLGLSLGGLLGGATVVESIYSWKGIGSMVVSAIAMSVALQSDLLLADEPTSALDVTVQAQVINTLMELHKTHQTTIVMVTHNLGVAAYIADYIAVMKNGEVVEMGKRDEIIYHPQHTYTKMLLASIPNMEVIDFAYEGYCN